MKSFEDWYFDLFETGNGICLNQQGIAEEAYLLGQQSKQAVIDSLHKNIDALHVENERLQKEYSMMFEGVQCRQKTIDELQKRMDDAIKTMEQNKPLMMYHHHAVQALAILKGESNES